MLVTTRLAHAQALDFLKEFAKDSQVNIQKEVNKQSLMPGRTPNGAHEKGPVRPECHPREFERLNTKAGMTAKEFASRLNEYFDRCGKDLHHFENSGLVGLIEFATTKYKILENSKIKAFSLPLKGDSVVRGFLAVRDTLQPRPWIIVKCGVFCSAEEGSAVNNYLIHLFDQTPFNVIFLNNRSGTDYIKDNQALVIGGYLEAHDYFEVSRWLTDESDYKHLVSSIHVLGISLSGSAALYASHLMPAYQAMDKRKYFDSISAICPVVNLKDTIDDMYANTAKGEIFVRYTWAELQKSKNDLKLANDYLGKNNRPKKAEFPGMLGNIIARYASRWNQNGEIRAAPPVQNIADLWTLSQYTEQAKGSDVPVFVWASKDDHIVNNKLNTETLMKSNLAQSSSNIGITNVPYGDHCGFATAYGFPVVASVLKTFILNNSKNFVRKKKLRTARVDFDSLHIPRGDIHTRYRWEAERGSSVLKVHFETFNSMNDLQCNTKDIYKSVQACRQEVTLKVPMTELGFLNLSPPQTKTEAEVLTRRLNANFEITYKGKALEGTSRIPTHVQWYSYY